MVLGNCLVFWGEVGRSSWWAQGILLLEGSNPGILQISLCPLPEPPFLAGPFLP